MGVRAVECVEVSVCHRASRRVSHHSSTATAEPSGAYKTQGQVKLFGTKGWKLYLFIWNRNPEEESSPLAAASRKNHLGFDLGGIELYKYLVSTGRTVFGAAVETRVFILSAYRTELHTVG